MGEKEKEVEVENKENKEKLPIPISSPESLILLVAPVAYYLQKKGRLNDSYMVRYYFVNDIKKLYKFLLLLLQNTTVI